MKICPLCLKPNATGKCMNRNCAVGARNNVRPRRACAPLPGQLVRLK